MGRIKIRHKAFINTIKTTVDIIRARSVKIIAYTAVLIFLAFFLFAACSNSKLRDFIEEQTALHNRGQVDKLIVYVSAEGNNENDGTIDAPVADIQTGIDKAQELITAYEEFDTAEVWVALGIYGVNYQGGIFITMREGVSLYGGYANDFSTRDSSEYPTVIVDQSTSGGTQGNFNIVVKVENGITAGTVLKGFTIQGGGGEYTCALSINQSSPTVQENVINGGNGVKSAFAVIISSQSSPEIQGNTINGGSSAGENNGFIILDYSAPLIQNNTIIGGSEGDSCAIFIFTDGTPTIQNNTISGGTGTSTYGVKDSSGMRLTLRWNTIHGGTGTGSTTGIRVSDGGTPDIYGNLIHGGIVSSVGGIICEGILVIEDSNPTIYNNIIFGGKAPDPVGVAGIRFEGSGGWVLNNTIDGGVGADVSCIELTNEQSTGSDPSITNNILFASGIPGPSSRTCINEWTDNGIYAQTIKNNDFWDISGGTILYHDHNDNTYTTASAINALSHAAGNIDLGPGLADVHGPDSTPETMEDNDWHLTDASPTSVSNGGVDGATAGFGFTTDKEDQTRTGNGSTGWSMGAYEKD